MAQPDHRELRDIVSPSPSAPLHYGPEHSTAFKYSLAQPHSCAHCQPVVFKADQFAENLPSALDPYLVVPDGVREYSLPLLDFSDAVVAARSGCALYVWVLDALCPELPSPAKLSLPCQSVCLFLLFEVDHMINKRWRIVCKVRARLEDAEGKFHKLYCPLYLTACVDDGK